MDISLFKQYLLEQEKIARSTRIAYAQDLQDFFRSLSSKYTHFHEITSYDIQNYVQALLHKRISHAYGIRIIAALKVFNNFMGDTYGINSMTQATFKIARFPIFCTQEELEQLLHLYAMPTNYSEFRDCLMLILLHRYGLTMHQLSQAQSERTLNNTRSAHIRFGGESSSIVLASEDHNVLKEYTFYVAQEIPQLTTHYLFPVQVGATIQPISTQALWSLLKKMWEIHTPRTSQTLLQSASYEHTEAPTVHHEIYRQKHPRS